MLNLVITFVHQDKIADVNINLRKCIYYIIPSEFDELADDELLSKCFHGEMQNSNESCNNIVSTRFPKTMYVSRSIMEVGVNSTFLHFNEGACAIKNILPYFKIGNSCYVGKVSIKRIKISVRKMDRKTSESGKTRREGL